MPFSVFIPCKYLSADFVISNAKFFHFSRKATAAAAYGDVAKNIQIPESMQRMMDKMSVEATLKQMGKLVKPAFVHELNAALNQIKKEG